MRIVVAHSANEIGRLCAESIVDYLLAQGGDAVLGLATGSSPLETYKSLISIAKKQNISFRNVKTINLDEYCGLGPEHPQSFRYYMDKNFFSQVDIPEENIEFLSGIALDEEKECERYDRVIERRGGIGFQLLGIGGNGHVAFNEPSEKFSCGTVEVQLTQETIQANSRFFYDVSEVPVSALTIGMETIFHARKIAMIATGEGKAEAVHAMLHGPITPQLPASRLQQHEDMTLYIDSVLAGYLQKKYGEI